MTGITASASVESAETVVGVALLFVCPVLFIIGAWLVDRCIRRHGSLAKRWFALAVFSVMVLALFFALIHVPPSWQFSGGGPTVVAISYCVGLGWLGTPLIAVPCVIIGVCGGIVSHLLATRRAAATR